MVIPHTASGYEKKQKMSKRVRRVRMLGAQHESLYLQKNKEVRE
tara:strand:+ start:620 stop:751 length:132 start_codon:yes stop_codon:yes gene_type:complete